MKKIVLILSFLTVIIVNAQTDGLNYQAVIIDPIAQELPWQDATGNILPNADVTLRFTIFDASGNVAYKETQDTRTDAYGMVNVIIGQGSPVSNATFTDIFWDGTRKGLQVEVKLNGQFADLGKSKLTFVPYAYHRDIIATGYFALDGPATMGDTLEVEGSTDLNGTLSVNNENPTNLSGTLTVEGVTDLNNTVNINNGSELNASGNVNVTGDTQLAGTLTVAGVTNLNNDFNVNNNSPSILTGSLRVDGQTDLNGDVNINNGSGLNVSGPLNVGGLTTLGDDLIVEGTTNLNNSLDVNNNSPSRLTGTLNVEGQTLLNNTLQVIGGTDVNNIFRVNNESSSILSGSLAVGLATNLNNGLWVNNGATTLLTGPLNVNGEIDFGNDLTVNGNTNLNDALFVNNNENTSFSGSLNVLGSSIIEEQLKVNDLTTINNTLTVTNLEKTYATGTLTVNGITNLNNSLTVTNGANSFLNGELNVDGTTVFQNSLTVTNASSTLLTGTLNVESNTTLQDNLNVNNNSATLLTGRLSVDEPTTLNDLNVSNGAATNLTGTLLVLGETNLNAATQVQGATLINNDLTVTGNTSLTSVTSGSINVSGDNTAAVASFSNTNTNNGDGIVIRLGRNHGLWNGSNYYSITNPIPADIDAALTLIESRFNNASSNPNFTPSDIFQLAPNSLRTGTLINTNNYIFQAINSGLDLPIEFPSLNMPGQILQNEITFYNGNSAVCSGQYCYSVCVPFVGCYTVCIPPVNVCVPAIPRIYFPGVAVPTIPIPTPNIPNPANYMPKLPIDIPLPSMPSVDLPIIPTAPVSNSLSKENQYFIFEDKDSRVTGGIRAQSLTDFRDNTILDNVYMLNLLSDFVGIDFVDGITAGVVGVTNAIDEFNKVGVEYYSGNGDYAEWLERKDPNEMLTAGDIIGVTGGKISRDLNKAEQVMVVSHRPIILGNMPDESKLKNGNSIAFMGQVPVKVLGPVNKGDYIVASFKIKGYGKAIAPNKMEAIDYKFAVGRSWETNLKEGPKLVNTVVGLNDYDFSDILYDVEKQQSELDEKLTSLDEKLKLITEKLNNSKENKYASER